VLNLEWCDQGVVTRGGIKRYGPRWMICVKEMEVLCQRDGSLVSKRWKSCVKEMEVLCQRDGRAGLKLLDGQEEEDDDVLRGEE
jgi:hypothetical protein